jgi:hypothetical protein
MNTKRMAATVNIDWDHRRSRSIGVVFWTQTMKTSGRELQGLGSPEGEG